jgi:hypothetical protein
MTENTITPDVKNTITEAVKQAREANGNAVYLAALATELVVRHDQIGAGRIYPTQADYASALGVSPSYVVKYKRIAKAVAKGITPDTDGWGYVTTHCGDKPVAAVIDGPKATKTKIVAAAKAEAKRQRDERARKAANQTPRMTADERKAKAKAEAAAKAKAEAAAKREAEAAAAKAAADMAPEARVRAALKVLREDLPKVDDAEWAKVAKIMVGLAERENLNRAKALAS